MTQTGGEERAEVGISQGGPVLGDAAEGARQGCRQSRIHPLSSTLGCRRPPCCKLLKHPKAPRGVLGAAPQQPGETGTQSLLHKQFPDTRVLSNSELQFEPIPNEPWRSSLGLITGAH